MNQLAKSTDTVSGYYARVWKAAWPNDPLPPRQRLTLVSEPQVPEQPVRSVRSAFLAIGLGVGLLAAWLVWRPKRNFKLAGYALLGMMAAFAASFAIGDRYTSRAVLRIGPVLAPKRIAPILEPEPPAERLRRIEAEALSPEVLTALITLPRLRVYQQDRAQKPVSEVVETMRNRDLRVSRIAGDALLISFTYSDRYKAQSVVRELVTHVVERDVLRHRALPVDNAEVRLAIEQRVGSPLEVLDPATLPELPVFPNRVAIGAMGLPLGLLAGVFALRRKQSVQAA
jgi:hypothetical protein